MPPKTREEANKVRKITKLIFAMLAIPTAMPVKPKSAEKKG